MKLDTLHLQAPRPMHGKPGVGGSASWLATSSQHHKRAARKVSRHRMEFAHHVFFQAVMWLHTDSVQASGPTLVTVRSCCCPRTSNQKVQNGSFKSRLCLLENIISQDPRSGKVPQAQAGSFRSLDCLINPSSIDEQLRSNHIPASQDPFAK